MKDLEDALLKIKESSNKYIRKNLLDRLDRFILGYTQSQLDKDGTYSDWLRKFQEFIQQKYLIFIQKMKKKHLIVFNNLIEEMDTISIIM